MESDKKNKQLEGDDQKYVWHPFTQMQDYVKEKPLIIEKGDGSYLWDIYGNKYLDGISSLWVTVHGHRRKELDQAIIEQVGKVSHSTLLGESHPAAIECARRLVEIAPQGLTKVFYSDSGSTAVEVALKIAYQYWQQKGNGQNEKKRFISLNNAYHGDTIGTVSVGGIDLFHEIYRPLLFETLKSPSPHCYRCELGESHPSCGLACLAETESIVEKYQDELAAFIIEPLVQGAAGMLIAPPGFLRGIREICTKYNVLLIADEVAVGFGRTGTMFACEQENVGPDILALGKGITGGYLPVAATLATDEIFNAFLGEHDEFRTFFHGHTYTGNPLGCAAAIASLNVFEKDDTLNMLSGKIEFLEKGLKRFWELPHVGDVRQAGCMIGIELVADTKTKEPFPSGKKVAIQIILEARKRGLIIRPLGDVLVLMPMLSSSVEQLDFLLQVTYDSIKAIFDK